MEANHKVCPKCGAHHKLTCRERFETFFDNKDFELIETPLPKDDPLNFEDKKKYTDRLKAARKLTGQDDAVLIAKGKVQNIDVVVGAQDFRFIGGSFGAASGEAFIAGIQHSIENNCPFIFYSCSGGQRMMESSIALMQMSRTALAVNELKKNKISTFYSMYLLCLGGLIGILSTGDAFNAFVFLEISKPKSIDLIGEKFGLTHEPLIINCSISFSFSASLNSKLVAK